MRRCPRRGALFTGAAGRCPGTGLSDDEEGGACCGEGRGRGTPLTLLRQSIALFRSSDKDGDGKLTMKELTSILKQYGQMDDEDDYTAEDEGDDEGGV